MHFQFSFVRRRLVDFKTPKNMTLTLVKPLVMHLPEVFRCCRLVQR